MVIIGFVVAIMLFSSFAIVFSNSENTLTNVKNNNNLNVKSFTTSNNITIPNAKNDLNTPIEFYNNFMLFVNKYNFLTVENISNSHIQNTSLQYKTIYTNNYYGIIENNSYLYVYIITALKSSVYNYQINVYIAKITINNLIISNVYNRSLSSITGGNEMLGINGITANNNGVYALNGYDISSICHPVFIKLNYYDNITEYKCFSNITITSNSNYSGYTMGNFYEFNTNGNNYLFNLNNFNIYSLGISNNYIYGEMIYNNSYENKFITLNNKYLNNTYISNNINYGCIYNPFIKTTILEPQIYNYRRKATTNNNNISFINANFYKNSYVNNNHCLIYNNTTSVKLNSFTLPYTLFNNTIYYSINSYSYGIKSLSIIYKINITSYLHNSTHIKDYFYYKNNIYYGNQFNFTNINGIFSILPLNYSSYVFNDSYIITSLSDFKSIGNGIYEYNLSIYYGQLTTNSTSSIKPLDISNYIYPIGIIIFVSFLGAMVYFSKNEGKK